MKASRLTLEKIAEPENLRAAFLRAARGKAHRAEVIAYRAALDANLAALRAELLAGATVVGRCTRFRIFEPKERIIHAPVFGERVLHHALIGPAEADFERWSISDNYACRRGKGREAALRRAEFHAASCGWFLKLDVKAYFDSIPHETLRAMIGPRWRDRRIGELWMRIISAYETAPGRGLPIGALTSQYLANFFLRPVDLWAQAAEGVRGYVRYMDDMALWGDDRAVLKAAKLAVEERLALLGLRLKASWHLQPTARGMDFLGYRVYPGGSRLARCSRRRFLRRWSWLERARERGAVTERVAQSRLLALVAFVRIARGEPVLRWLFGRTWGDGHRAPTASTGVAAGITTPPTAVRPTATTTRRATATTTSAFASPSAQAGMAGPSSD
jgi:RNA-directed DNA polymerase